eukprot:1562579-Karenia_brevis.AAC.1
MQQGADDDSSDAPTEKAQDEEIPVDDTLGIAVTPPATVAEVPGTPLAPAADDSQLPNDDEPPPKQPKGD